MIARHPLYTPTTGSRVGSNQRPPYPSHPQPFPVGIHLGDQTPPPAFPLPPTRNLPRRPDDLAHGLVLLNTFPSPPRQLPDPVQELPGPAGASQSCIDVHRPWRIYIYIYLFTVRPFSSLLALTKLSVAILTQTSLCAVHPTTRFFTGSRHAMQSLIYITRCASSRWGNASTRWRQTLRRRMPLRRRNGQQQQR